jgi:hypothetical protein
MEIIEKHVFICPLCREEYKTKQEAIDCLNSTDKAICSVGDIVEVRYGFGWFDGDERWVINPKVDMSKHGFGPDCSMGFYYVVSAIDLVGHRTRYHVITNAMSVGRGYRSGYTFNKGHRTPQIISAPDFVVNDSKKLIGLKAENLI